MARRRQARRDLRGDASLAQGRRILVVCEGKLTEPKYPKAFANEKRSQGVVVEIDGPAGDPVTLVERATELRDAALHDPQLAYDEVWCCFDVDQFGARVPEARSIAASRGLRLAMTNPCFELWLILHLRDSPGAKSHHEMQKEWRKLQPELAEKDINYAVLAPHHEEAVARATRLKDDALRRGDDPAGNPSTEMHDLTDSIDREAAIGVVPREPAARARVRRVPRKLQPLRSSKRSPRATTRQKTEAATLM
jgi:hypothetical protein